MPISAGSAMRASGIAASSIFILAGSSIVDLLIGVATAPGPTPTTRTPCGPSSTPAVRVNMRMPPLDRQYGVLPGMGQSSCTDVMLMMAPPPPWAIICLAAICVPKKALFRLIAITFSYCASVVSRIDVRVSTPALFTITSTRPNALTASSTSRCRSSTLLTSAFTPMAWSPSFATSRSRSSVACSSAT